MIVAAWGFNLATAFWVLVAVVIMAAGAAFLAWLAEV
jgi:preprotein translocase subunit SecY